MGEGQGECERIFEVFVGGVRSGVGLGVGLGGQGACDT